MNTVPFTVNGQSFRFDESHGTNTGYKLIFWHWENGSLTRLPVGDYQESLYLNKSLIQFHTTDQKVKRVGNLILLLSTSLPRHHQNCP